MSRPFSTRYSKTAISRDDNSYPGSLVAPGAIFDRFWVGLNVGSYLTARTRGAIQYLYILWIFHAALSSMSSVDWSRCCLKSKKMPSNDLSFLSGFFSLSGFSSVLAVSDVLRASISPGEVSFFSKISLFRLSVLTTTNLVGGIPT